MGSRIALTNNEIKDIIKAIKCLENRGIFLKWTTEKNIVQEGEFLNFLGSIMKHVFTPITENVLLPLGVTAAVSATDAAIQKKIYESGMTKLIISNKEMKDIIKIVKSLEESS